MRDGWTKLAETVANLSAFVVSVAWTFAGVVSLARGEWGDGGVLLIGAYLAVRCRLLEIRAERLRQTNGTGREPDEVYRDERGALVSLWFSKTAR